MSEADKVRKDRGTADTSKAGEWGDVTDTGGKDILAILEAQEKEEQRLQNERDTRKRNKEAVRVEREAEEVRKKAETEARLELERPVADLLKSLRFLEPIEVEISAAALTAFAKLNRTSLRALGIDVPAQPSKKALLPALLDGVKSWPPTVAWIAAPPRALPEPAADETDAQMPCEPETGLPLAGAREAATPADSPHGTPMEGPSKRTRRATAAENAAERE